MMIPHQCQVHVYTDHRGEADCHYYMLSALRYRSPRFLSFISVQIREGSIWVAPASDHLGMSAGLPIFTCYSMLKEHLQDQQVKRLVVTRLKASHCRCCCHLKSFPCLAGSFQLPGSAWTLFRPVHHQCHCLR